MTSISKIERIETFLLDIPTIRPHQLSMTTMHVQTLVIVRISTSDGIRGIGEATTIGGLSYGPESPEGIKLTIDTYIAPLLLQCETQGVAPTMAFIGKGVKGNHFAKCAVETALLDIQGKRLQVPVSELLGGRFRERLSVAWTLASGDTGRDIAEAETMLETRRHRVFKLKIGRYDIAADIKHVAAIKLALGDRASIRVDVNQAWSEAMATAALSKLDDAGVELIEQPILAENRAGLSRLSAKSRIPIMADEALHGPESAFGLASTAAATVFAVKIAQSGGLYAAGRVGAIADAGSIGLYGGTMLEGPVGTIAAAHVFAAFPRLEWGTELFGPLLLTENILQTPIDYSDFCLAVPKGFGLGIELEDELIKPFERADSRRVHSATVGREL